MNRTRSIVRIALLLSIAAVIASVATTISTGPSVASIEKADDALVAAAGGKDYCSASDGDDLPTLMDVSQAKRPFHGFCRCGCSLIPDCNTSADCGGGVCSRAISCC